MEFDLDSLVRERIHTIRVKNTEIFHFDTSEHFPAVNLDIEAWRGIRYNNT
jgi:hypothetical protein